MGLRPSPFSSSSSSYSPPTWVLDILSNEEVIEINQSPPYEQAFKVTETTAGLGRFSLYLGEFVGSYSFCLWGCAKTQVWIKPMAEGRVAVAFLNLGFDVVASNLFGETAGKTEDVMVGKNYVWGHYEDVMGRRTEPEERVCARDIIRRKDLGVVEGDNFVARNVPPRSIELWIVKPC
jgi:hypothetical protein